MVMHDSLSLSLSISLSSSPANDTRGGARARERERERVSSPWCTNKLRAQLTEQQIPPLNTTPATYHKRRQKLHCNFTKMAVQKLQSNIRSFCSTDIIFTQSCGCSKRKGIEKAASQGKWHFPAAVLRTLGACTGHTHKGDREKTPNSPESATHSPEITVKSP